MNKDTKYAIFKVQETLLQSIISDSFTFFIVAMCVYISRDSAAWTVVTVCMFVMGAFAKIGQESAKGTKLFKTKAELQEWVDSLD